MSDVKKAIARLKGAQVIVEGEAELAAARANELTAVGPPEPTPIPFRLPQTIGIAALARRLDEVERGIARRDQRTLALLERAESLADAVEALPDEAERQTEAIEALEHAVAAHQRRLDEIAREIPALVARAERAERIQARRFRFGIATGLLAAAAVAAAMLVGPNRTAADPVPASAPGPGPAPAVASAAAPALAPTPADGPAAAEPDPVPVPAAPAPPSPPTPTPTPAAAPAPAPAPAPVPDPSPVPSPPPAPAPARGRTAAPTMH